MADGSQGLSGLIGAFITAAARVLAMETGSEVSLGQSVQYQAPLRSPDEVAVLVGISGLRLKGVVLYAMSEVTALNLASAMIGEVLTEFNALAESAVSELANVFAGNASVELERKGYPCRLSPPSVISGEGLLITLAEVGLIRSKLSTQHGELSIILALREPANVSQPA